MVASVSVRSPWYPVHRVLVPSLPAPRSRRRGLLRRRLPERAQPHRAVKIAAVKVEAAEEEGEAAAEVVVAAKIAALVEARRASAEGIRKRDESRWRFRRREP